MTLYCNYESKKWIKISKNIENVFRDMKLPLENNMRPWKDLFLLIIEHTIKFHWNPLVIMVSVQNDLKTFPWRLNTEGCLITLSIASETQNNLKNIKMYTFLAFFATFLIMDRGFLKNHINRMWFYNLYEIKNVLGALFWRFQVPKISSYSLKYVRDVQKTIWGDSSLLMYV